MRITLAIEGGLAHFPGLARPAVLELDALPPAERAHLCSLAEAAHFWSEDEAPRPPDPPDTRSYTLEFDDGKRCRTRCLQEPVADPRMRALLEAVREALRRR